MCSDHFAVVEVAEDGVGVHVIVVGGGGRGEDRPTGNDSLSLPDIVNCSRHEGAVTVIVNGGGQLPRGAVNRHTADVTGTPSVPARAHKRAYNNQ